MCLAGVYGPPVGKRCVLFVDDLNLPQTDAFGTHPPLELLRQLVDHATWYDIRKEVEPIHLEDMQVSSVGFLWCTVREIRDQVCVLENCRIWCVNIAVNVRCVYGFMLFDLTRMS